MTVLEAVVRIVAAWIGSRFLWLQPFRLITCFPNAWDASLRLYKLETRVPVIGRLLTEIGGLLDNADSIGLEIETALQSRLLKFFFNCIKAWRRDFVFPGLLLNFIDVSNSR